MIKLLPVLTAALCKLKKTAATNHFCNEKNTFAKTFFTLPLIAALATVPAEAQISFSSVSGAANPLSNFGATVDGANSWLPGDFDGDGDMDLIGRVPSDNAVAYWRNNGNNSYTQLTGTANPFHNISFAASVTNFLSLNTAAFDVDNDGDVDVFNNGLNQVWRNDGANFTTVTDHPLTGFSATVDGLNSWTTGDFDGDGDIDLMGRVPADNALAYWRNNSNNTFTQLTGAANPFIGITFSSATTNNFLTFNTAVLDIDNDGDMDIFNNAVNAVFSASGSAPVLTSATPANNATNVNTSSDIKLTFNENMFVGPGNIYLMKAADHTVAQTIAASSAAVTGSGTQVITINPPADFAGTVSYYVTFDRNALRDADGVIFGRTDHFNKKRMPETGSSFLGFSTMSTLPVSLLSFTAVLHGGKALLHWQTAGEAESRDFTVQYSADGVRWKNIGVIAAAGNSTTQRQYRYQDAQTLHTRAYYRLLQTDSDGINLSISPVRMLEAGVANEISLYPNPAMGDVHLQLPSRNKAVIMLYNTAGAEVYRKEVTADLIPTVSLQKLPAGCYQVVVHQDGKNYAKQMIRK